MYLPKPTDMKVQYLGGRVGKTVVFCAYASIEVEIHTETASRDLKLLWLVLLQTKTHLHVVSYPLYCFSYFGKTMMPAMR